MAASSRILVFNDTAVINGGAERSVLLMVRGLDRTRFLTDFASFQDGAMVSEMESRGVQTYGLKAPSIILEPRSRLFGHPFRAARFCQALVAAGRTLAQHVRQTRPDLVYTFSMKGHLVSLASGAWHNAAIAWDFREADVPRWFLASLLTLGRRRVTGISVQSHQTQVQLHSLFPSERIARLPNCLAPEEVTANQSRTSVREQLGLDDRTFLMISAGRITSRKGFHHLIEAMQSVPTGHLIICGAPSNGEDASYLDFCRTQTRLRQLEQRITFLGARQDLSNLLAASDLAVLPSQSEEQSRFIMEAMCLGIPVIATDVGGMREILNPPHSGWIVPPNQPQALASAICEIQDNDAVRIDLGKSAASRIRTTFNIQDQIHKREDFFNESIIRWKNRGIKRHRSPPFKRK